MAEAGLLGDARRVELIDGEIIDMASIGSPHAEVTNRLARAPGADATTSLLVQ